MPGGWIEIHGYLQFTIKFGYLPRIGYLHRDLQVQFTD
jgi:hypothetical protein